MILVIILEILIGALVGWLAGKLMKSKNKRFWINCLVGSCWNYNISRQDK